MSGFLSPRIHFDFPRGEDGASAVCRWAHGDSARGAPGTQPLADPSLILSEMPQSHLFPRCGGGSGNPSCGRTASPKALPRRKPGAVRADKGGRGDGALGPQPQFTHWFLCARRSLLHTPSSALCQASGCGARRAYERQAGARECHTHQGLESGEALVGYRTSLGGGGLCLLLRQPVALFKK